MAFEQVPLWEHGVLEVRRVTPGPVRVGTRLTARRVYAGRETRLEGPVVELVEGRSATIALRGGPLNDSRVTYEVEPIDGGRALVTYRASGRLRGPLKLIEPLLPAIGRAEARKNLVSLHRRIAAGIGPDADIRTPSS